ncbi:MAG: metallophosphoesterase [Deltaproteobacteria bacterium]|nr:metallophosphoesterase [Deltaproteobacteria bacterium]
MTSLSRIWKLAVATGIVVILFISPITIMLRRYGMNNKGMDILVWTGYLGLGFLSFIFTFLVIRDVLCLPAAIMNKLKRILPAQPYKRSDPAIPENPSRRGFLVNSMNYGILATASLTTGYGIVEAKRVPEVKKVQVPITALPKDFHGFRIVQVTDLHVSPTIRRPYVEKVVEIVNSLNADIFALTGDLIDGTISQLSDDVAPLKNIQSAQGNFFITGNHEYYFGVTDWVTQIKRLGFSILLNEYHMIDLGRGSLLLAGVTDFRGGNFLHSHRSDPIKAVAGAPAADIKILLAHQPKSIFDAATAGFDLQISGHTHGGQFFPWNFFVGFNQPFVSGLHKYKSTHIYVSRGTGYWGPPVRVGAPSEITLIKLISNG